MPLMLDELEAAWRELDDDPEVRVIVNTAAGGPFQTGLDVVQLVGPRRPSQAVRAHQPGRAAADVLAHRCRSRSSQR